MDTLSKILIIAKPGHFRDSLVAVLKTLPRSELFLVDQSVQVESIPDLQALASFMLADLDGIGADEAACIGALRKRYSGIRCVLMANNYQQIRAAGEFDADVVLPRNASAGELLSTFQRLSGGQVGATRYFRPFPVPLVP